MNSRAAQTGQYWSDKVGLGKTNCAVDLYHSGSTNIPYRHPDGTSKHPVTGRSMAQPQQLVLFLCWYSSSRGTAGCGGHQSWAAKWKAGLCLSKEQSRAKLLAWKRSWWMLSINRWSGKERSAAVCLHETLHCARLWAVSATACKAGIKIPAEVQGLKPLTRGLNSEIKFQQHWISFCLVSHKKKRTRQEGRFGSHRRLIRNHTSLGGSWLEQLEFGLILDLLTHSQARMGTLEKDTSLRVLRKILRK